MNDREDSVERWAHFVKEHPSEWKKIHTRFINAQFDMHAAFLQRLKKTPGGREKIILLYGIKNVEGYKGLLG